jgi:hypothetical protein
MKKINPIPLSVTLLLIISLACVLPSIPVAAPTQDINALGTLVMQTMVAAATQTAQVLPPADTLTPSPVWTATLPPTITETPLPTLTPTPLILFTATSSVPQVSVSVATNCRVGPGRVYDRVGALLVGQVAEVVGRNASGNYWYIRNPQTGGLCWLWGEYATVTGNPSVLPVYTPPPTPTPMPDFVAEYNRLEVCNGWWVDIELENTGGIAFESFSLTIRDPSMNVVMATSSDSFTEVDGCALSSRETLNPGNSPNVSSPPFSYNPSGHELETSITLCSRNGLNGTCLTKTIRFRP